MPEPNCRCRTRSAAETRAVPEEEVRGRAWSVSRHEFVQVEQNAGDVRPYFGLGQCLITNEILLQLDQMSFQPLDFCGGGRMAQAQLDSILNPLAVGIS